VHICATPQGEVVTSVAASSAAVLSAVACTCSGRAARRAAAKATAKAAAAKKAAKSQSQPPPSVRPEKEEQLSEEQQPPPPAPLSKAADTAAVAAAAETVAPATPPSTLTLPLSGSKTPVDDNASVAVDEKEAEAAAEEADRLTRKMMKPAKWLREKVRLCIGLRGRLTNRWVVLQGDLLWIMHASMRDEEGREAEVKELGKMSEYVVNVHGATIQSVKDKCGGVITITGLRAFHFQAMKLFFGSHTALLRWKSKLDAAVGQAELPDKLEKALKRSASAPSRAVATGSSNSRAHSQTRAMTKPSPNNFSQAFSNLDTTARTLSPNTLTANTPFNASYASYASVASVDDSAMGDELTTATAPAGVGAGVTGPTAATGTAAERSRSVPSPAMPQLSGVSIGSTSPSSTTQQLQQLQQQLQSLQEQAQQVQQQQQQQYQQQYHSGTPQGNWTFPRGLRAGNVLEPSPCHGGGGAPGHFGLGGGGGGSHCVTSTAESVVGSVGARTVSAVPGDNLTPRSSASGNGKGFGSRSDYGRGGHFAPVTPISPPSSVLGFGSSSVAAPPGYSSGGYSARSRDRLLQHRSGAITPPAMATRKPLSGGFPISGYYAWRAQLQAAQQQLLECEQHAESLYQFFPRNRWQRPDGSRTPTRMYSTPAPSSYSPAASVSALSQSGGMGAGGLPGRSMPPPTTTTATVTATAKLPSASVPMGLPMEPIAAPENSPANESTLWGSPISPGDMRGYNFMAGQTPSTAAASPAMAGSPQEPPVLPRPRPISKLEGGYGLEYVEYPGVPPLTRPGLA